MIIIPDTPFDNESYAEKVVFDRLKECFVRDNKFIAFHSFGIRSHQSQRTGEADFLILCSQGIFVLEVKGGEISYEDGRWYTKNANGKHPLKQDPFKQAEKAIFSIEKDLRKIPALASYRFTIGYGVIFPTCKWNVSSGEWSRTIICDGMNFRNFEKWLVTLFSYWRGKPNNMFQISDELIPKFKEHIRPNFELVEILYDRILKTERNSVKLTDDQYTVIDLTMDNDRVLCAGGAGTGKTFLAAELARRKGKSEKNVLFVCKSPWLRNYLSTKVPSTNVTVSTAKGAKQALRRKGISSVDVLIVDEGQDLFNFDDLELLDSVLFNGLENGQWYIFHDTNNQSNLVSDLESDAYDYIRSLNNPVKINLRTNCRNTLNILNKVQESLHLDMGATGTGNGPPVFELNLAREEVAIALENKISELLKSDVPQGSITILSPLRVEDSVVSSLPPKIISKISMLDEYGARVFPPNEISYSEIQDFKGMENEVILLVDLKHPSRLGVNEDRAAHYVGMSRARGLLCVFWEK